MTTAAPGARARPEIALLIGLLIVSALALAFGLLAEDVLEGETIAFDRSLILLFRDAHDPSHLLGPVWLPEMVRDVTSLGSVAILAALVAIAAGYFALTRMRVELAVLLVSAIGGQGLSTILKWSFERGRPDLVPGAPQVFTTSFPSGHAMLSAVIYLTIGALLSRHEARRALRTYFMAIAVGLTVAVGVSRVLLGVHWPSDVLGGWCIGAAWALACWIFCAWFEHRYAARASAAGRAGV